MFVSFETRLDGTSREAQHVSPSRGGIFVIVEVSLNGSSREAQEKLKRLCLTGGSIFANFEVLRLGTFKILKEPQERLQRPPARPAPTNNVIQEQQIRILVRPLLLMS